MKDLEYGKNYKYNPDFAGHVEQEYLPKELQGKKYITTSEKKVAEEKK
jgi:putative ATPase